MLVIMNLMQIQFFQEKVVQILQALNTTITTGGTVTVGGSRFSRGIKVNDIVNIKNQEKQIQHLTE